MGTAELLAALRSEGKRKEEAIRRRAGEEAARLREEAALGLARLREMHLQEQERLIAAQERAILAEAERAARRVRLVAEEEMASRFHDLARRLLPRLRDGDYPAAFARLAAELPPLAWETVRVNPADGERAVVHFPGAHRDRPRHQRWHGGDHGGGTDAGRQHPGKAAGSGLARHPPPPPGGGGDRCLT